jgi:formamidopyrimidine-DNA glycosylase
MLIFQTRWQNWKKLMPELPEVETIRCALLSKLKGKVIIKASVKNGSRLLRDTVSAATLKKKLIKQRIKDIKRRGKYLILEFSSGDFLVVHLGMTGVIYTIDNDQASPTHTHLRAEFKGFSLVLSDPRTFGRLFYVKKDGLNNLPALNKLGPEPLEKEFTRQIFRENLKNRKAPIKAVLLDQKAVSGLGNIYCDEALFRSAIHPLKKACDLSVHEIKKLHQEVRAVLKESIACQGCTIRDYQWDQGKSGGFAKKLRIYGKEDKTCLTCHSKILRSTVAGRSTFYCPNCQK